MDNDNDNVRKTLASALHIHHAFLTFLVHLFDVHRTTSQCDVLRRT